MKLLSFFSDPRSGISVAERSEAENRRDKNNVMDLDFDKSSTFPQSIETRGKKSEEMTQTTELRGFQNALDKNENKKEDGEDDLISEKLLEDDLELDDGLLSLPI